MTVHSFPALGFDPAPGSPDAVAGLSRDCGALSRALIEDSSRVRALADGGMWRGEAADAFRHRLEDLPRDLDRAAEAYGMACGALARFSISLLEAQHASHALEQRAASATDDTGKAAVARDADTLRSQVQVEADLCARVLHDATRHAPHAPSWFSRMVDTGVRLVQEVNRAVGDFVRKHAEVIAGFAAALSKASSLLSLVAMLAGPIPVIGQAIGSLAATGALIAAGGALALHTALAVYADGPWSAVVLDATAVALGLGPRGVEAAAKPIVAARALAGGEELGAVSMSTREALAIVRHPAAGVARMSDATMTFPGLVTRTVSYQFDLAAGAVGTVDLAQLGRVREELQEAGERGRREQERVEAADGDPRLVEVVACPS